MSKDKWVKNRKGQTLIELALVLPILLMLVFGIIEFGRVFNAYVLVSNASREGARQASVGKADSDVRTKVKDVASSLGLEEGDININPGKGSRDYGDQVTVTVNYELPIIAPLIDVILDPDGDGNYQLQVSTSMRVEKE
ncbi:TadE-like protein [Peptoclostridium litorale DSM 5388]|uniref:TadE-like domain-containing protein n=1 Tax=Peptoclostridium litorale DSM 5388 TaxID=1121324 RepID=A0A069R9N1_PEPLI|nr:TadE/TadG family type IV pilus assembly protein [Peptoclostridium litorale]KDR93774.1 hypothetical protein CLIT_23c00460 [Peptoclostridium litorale DSM 5388]SIN85602.1 TadE-like protein [Peptoclostridium litorale DSM 5388]